DFVSDSLQLLHPALLTIDRFQEMQEDKGRKRAQLSYDKFVVRTHEADREEARQEAYDL
ncbi:MAG: hypothetical protein SGPRY_012541, partial [Prymnesium sp.]